MSEEEKISAEKKSKLIFYIVAVSVVARAVIASSIEFGNDEVYYWIYAKYPALSHFDHPPMVGYFIQIFSLNLLLSSEFFIRLSSVIFGGINTYLIFLIAKKIKDENAGLFAAVLYNTSFYCFIIAGVFIMPDTPMLFFWLLGFYFLVTSVTADDIGKIEKRNLLFAGLVIGFAMLSKYHSAFLWLGVYFYVQIFNRKWFRHKELYIAPVISLIIFVPVIVWNIQNDFISFTFQGERVTNSGSGINLNYFLTELSGQIFYNNPVNFFLAYWALFSYSKKRSYIEPRYFKFILLTALPMILVFFRFSLYRQTLPHWTGPAYTLLLLLVAAKLSSKYEKFKLATPQLISAISIIAIVVTFAIVQINYGVLDLDKSEKKKATELGSQDVTLDMYGLRYVGEEFEKIYKRDAAEEKMKQGSPLITFRWFPAANFEYYVAERAGINVMAIGGLDAIHKYYWINNIHGGFKKGMDGYYLVLSRDYKKPEDVFGKYFESIETGDTITVIRNNKPAYYAFVFRLKNLVTLP